MSRGFGTGGGTSAVAVVTLGLNTYRDSGQTISVHCYPISQGTSNLGRLLDKGEAAGNNEIIYFDGSTPISTTDLLYSRGRATTGGLWRLGAMTFSAWNRVAFKIDNSSTSNNPICWINGTQQSVITATAPSGAVGTAGTSNYRLGNRATNDRAWNGWIAEFAIWNTMLADDLLQDLSLGKRPLEVAPASLAVYAPLLGSGLYDASGKGVSVTQSNTAVRDHGLVIQSPGG